MFAKRLIFTASLALFAFANVHAPLFAQSKADIAASLRQQEQGNFSADFVSHEQNAVEDSRPFALDAAADVAITAGGLGLIGVDYLLGKKQSAKAPNFTGVLNKDDIPTPVDAKFMRPYNKTWDTTGDVLQIVSMLTPAVLAMAPKKEWATIGVMYAESVIWAYAARGLGKSIAFRARPYMYFDGYPAKKLENGDWLNSFPSGHTTLAFNAAAFTTYVYSTYYPESKLRIPVAVGSYALAFATAASRMASGSHFLTDVLTGAVIGTETGLLVPILHTYLAQFSRTHNGRTLTASLFPNGLLFKYKY